jgi:hypothetical protein
MVIFLRKGCPFNCAISLLTDNNRIQSANPSAVGVLCRRDDGGCPVAISAGDLVDRVVDVVVRLVVVVVIRALGGCTAALDDAVDIFCDFDGGGGIVMCDVCCDLVDGGGGGIVMCDVCDLVDDGGGGMVESFMCRRSITSSSQSSLMSS